MKKALAIIGVGSPFGADNIAESIIDSLKQNISTPSSILITYLDRPGIGLLDTIKDYQLLVIIDAMYSGQSPVGTLYFYDSLTAFQQAKPVSSHQFGVAEVLALGQNLSIDLPKEFLFYGIEIPQFHVQLDVKKQLLAAKKQLVEKLMHMLARYTA